MAAVTPRRDTPKTFLDPELSKLKLALEHRASVLGAKPTEMSQMLAAELRALAGELHHW